MKDYWSNANKYTVGNMIMHGYTGPLEDMPPNDWIIKIAGSGQKVLDFGCGVGRHSKALSKNFIEVVGYDLPNMIDIVPESNKLKNIQYTSDWESVKHKKFDLIFAYLVLSEIHEQELRKFLQDMCDMTNRIIIRNNYWGVNNLNMLTVLGDFFNIKIVREDHEDPIFYAVLTKK